MSVNFLYWESTWGLGLEVWYLVSILTLNNISLDGFSSNAKKDLYGWSI